MTIRYRTCGDMPITGAVESEADTLEKLLKKLQPLEPPSVAAAQMINGQKLPWKIVKNKDIFKI